MATRERLLKILGSSSTVQLLLSGAAVVFALVVGAVLLAVTKHDVGAAYAALWQGAFGNQQGIAETLISSTPLILGGLAVTLSFRCNLFNLGAEGCIVLGGLGAAWAGFYVTGLPAYIHLPLALIAGALVGAFWSAIAGWLKARLNMNEVITTIMMNYIAFNIAGYAVSPGGPMKAPGVIPASPIILDSAKLPRILGDTRLHAGIFVALLCVGIVWWLLFRTRLGYAIRAVGLNPFAAEFGGIRVSRNIIVTMAISGVLSGLAGAVEVLGVHYRLFESFSPGYGWDAIAVALLGVLHPVGTLLAALLFGALRSGSTLMQTVANVSRDMIMVVSALIIYFIALTGPRKARPAAAEGGKTSGSVETPA